MKSLSDRDVEILRRMIRWFNKQPSGIQKAKRNTPPRMLTTAVSSLKIGVTNSDISPGTQGVISVWRSENGSPQETTDDLSVHLDWMHGGETVSSGKQVVVAYFDDEDLWRIIGAECE